MDGELGDRHEDAVPPGCAAGERGDPLLGLDLSWTIGGPDLEAMRASVGLPVVRPLTPEVDRPLFAKAGLLPLAAVHADLHLGDAAVLGVG